MRLYRTSFVVTVTVDEAEVNQTHCNWQGSMADAATARREAKSEGYQDVQTEEIDVPTQKQNLLEFLNEHATTVSEPEDEDEDEEEEEE